MALYVKGCSGANVTRKLCHFVFDTQLSAFSYLNLLMNLFKLLRWLSPNPVSNHFSWYDMIELVRFYFIFMPACCHLGWCLFSYFMMSASILKFAVLDNCLTNHAFKQNVYIHEFHLCAFLWIWSRLKVFRTLYFLVIYLAANKVSLRSSCPDDVFLKFLADSWFPLFCRLISLQQLHTTTR